MTVATTVSLGNHAKLTARPADRPRIRRFYQEVLDCRLSSRSEAVDFFRLGDAFFIAVIYDGAVLSDEEQVKSVWLELTSDDPAALTNRIREFGVTEIETWEKERLYFQAPGGQVFRIAGTGEDLSMFES